MSLWVTRPLTEVPQEDGLAAQNFLTRVAEAWHSQTREEQWV